jgi:hypothetical protein
VVQVVEHLPGNYEALKFKPQYHTKKSDFLQEAFLQTEKFFLQHDLFFCILISIKLSSLTPRFQIG